MKYLSIDYGKRKIGLATSEGELVTGYGSIRVEGLDEAVIKIDQIIGREEIDHVVIGLPESGESRKMVESFIKAIKQEKGIEVVTADETLSTSRAQDEIRELGGGDEDERAAMIILEGYLGSI